MAGAFVLVLWEWDAEVRSHGQVTELRSGRDRTGMMPEPAASAVYPTVSHARQQYIYVEDGVLTIPRMDDTTHWAFLDTPSLSTQGTLHFKDATGQLEQGGLVHAIEAVSLNVAGNLAAQDIRSTGQALHIGLGGLLESAESDGQPLSFATNTGPSAAWWPWLFGLIGAVLASPVFIPLGRRALRRRHLATVSAQAQELLNLNRCDEAEPLVEELAQLAPWDPRVRHQKALMLECRGDYRGAVELRRALDAALQAERVASPALLAENRFQLALLGGRLHGRTVGLERTQWGHTALRYLREAVTVNPSLADYVPLHPELAGLHPDLRTTPADQLFTN